MNRKQEGILLFFARHNQHFSLKVGYSRTQSSYVRYRTVYNHLEAFIRSRYHREDLSWRDINNSFVEGFDTWLRSERHLSANTVWGYMISLKHIVMLARNEGRMSFDPFATYINSYTYVDRGYLSEEELIRLMEMSNCSDMDARVRDLFLFSAFTGMAYVDIKQLRKEHVRKMFDGQWWIIKRRQKTGVDSNIRLLDVPLRIVWKYWETGEDERLFPIPSNNCCNVHLKRIAQQCRIDKDLTFHKGRHTFATMALNRGMPIESLSRILGHTNIRTTQIYAKITNKKLSEDMALLSASLAQVEKSICRHL